MTTATDDTIFAELAAELATIPTTPIVGPSIAASDVTPYLASKTPVYIDLWVDEKRGESLRVYVGGPKTGLYARTELPGAGTVEMPDGTKLTPAAEKLIVPWVAVRTRAYSEVSFRDGRFEETGDNEFDVLVLSPKGQRVLRRMTAADASNISRVLEGAATMGLPEPQAYDAVHVRNMLRMLGAAECEVETDVVTGGWVDIEGEGAGFLDAKNAITANGISNAYKVKVEGADRFSGTSLISTEGAAETLAAWFAILPQRLDLAMATFSAVMASYLGLARRTTLYIAAEPDSGKTLLLGATSMWSCDRARRGAPSANLYSDATASTVAIHDRMSIMAAPTYWDDLRFSHPKAFEFIDIITRGGYQPEVRTKSAGAGKGEKKQLLGATKTVPIVTAEALPESTQTGSVLNRMVITAMRAGDLDWSDDEDNSNAIKRWNRDFAGRANALRGAFVQYLAAKANSLGGVDAFMAAMSELSEDTMQQLDTGGMSRQAEVVSVLRTGWDMFIEFLDSIGVEMPVNAKAANEAWNTILVNAQERGAQANPVRRMLEHLRDSIGDGYFEAIDSTIPGADAAHGFRYNPGALGYRRDGDNRWHPKSSRSFGYVSLNGDYALITTGGIKWARATFDATKTLPLTDQQLGAGFDKLMKEGIVADHTYGAKQKTGLNFGVNRRPGVVVPISWLLGDADEPKDGEDDAF